MSSTFPADQTKNAHIECAVPSSMARSKFTGLLDFVRVKKPLSSPALRRPKRLKPGRDFTNAELKAIAAAYPPPPEWFEGEDECPFILEK